MTRRDPGFLDDLPQPPSRPALPDPDPEETPAAGQGDAVTPPGPSAGPMLLAAEEALPGGRIDHGWAPETLRPRPVRAGALTWIAAGVAVLLLGWLGLSGVGFVLTGFREGAELGWLALAVFGCGLALIATGLVGELRAWRRLRQVDALRGHCHVGQLWLERTRQAKLAACRPSPPPTPATVSRPRSSSMLSGSTTCSA